MDEARILQAVAELEKWESRRERVRQIEAAAIKKLRKAIAA